MNTEIFVCGAVVLVVLTGILVSLLCAGHREKVDDTNKKVVLHGGKNLNSNLFFKGEDILEEKLDQVRTVIKSEKRQTRTLVCRLTEQKRNIVYEGWFVDRKITVGHRKKNQEYPEEGRLNVKDRKVSYEHCRIYCERDRYLIQDCHSTNHTWVNGKPVTATVFLKTGDRLRLANKTYKVEFLWSIQK